MFNANVTNATTVYIVTWHSSIKQNASFKWKISKFSEEIDIQVGKGNDSIGTTFEFRITNTPPNDSYPTIMNSSHNWVDLYIDGSQRKDEISVGMFFTPLSAYAYGIETNGYLLPHTATRYMDGLIGYFTGYIGEFSDSISGTSWTGHREVSYMKDGTVKTDFEVDMVYSTETGLLKRFYMMKRNSTTTLKYEIIRDTGGLFGTGISGFDLSVFLFTLFILPILLKKRE